MNRIKELRLQKNITMSQASKDLNIPYTTYVNYEKEEREPNSEMLIVLANYFNVSVDYLIGRSNSKEATFKLKSPNITENTITFPVIGEIAAGYDNIALEDWSGETVEIPFSYLKGRKREDYFVLSVKGNSMYPKYINGDKVLILKQSTLNRSGDIGAIMYDDELATLKKVEYVMGEDWLRLVPINPEYEPKTIQGENLEHCRIIGIPKLLIREIDE